MNLTALISAVRLALMPSEPQRTRTLALPAIQLRRHGIAMV
jgi:hypothetical protein